MRAKFKVPLYGNLNRSAIVAVGAQVGTDLYLPDGSVASLKTLAEALQKYLTSSSSSSSGGVGGLSVTLWSLIQDIPPNIVEAAALASVGLVTRKSSGDWITSVLQGTAGRIVVTHGDGDLGDPTIDLAAVSQGSGGNLVAITIDGYGRVSQNRPADLVDLADVVYLSGTPTDGQVLTYDSYLGVWIPATPTGGGGGGGGFPPQIGYAGGI